MIILMKRSYTYRYRRPSATTVNDGTFFKKENHEQSFFGGNGMHESFFQPAAVNNNAAVQRKCEHCDDEEKKQKSMPEKKQEEDKKLHRAPDKKDDDDKKLQKKESATSIAGAEFPVAGYINNLNSNGQSLPKTTQQFFGSRMGYDFSNVKIHTDKDAAQSAKVLNAKAYAIDNHVVFNQGAYNDTSADGKKLLAHELTHVIQQNNGVARQIQRAKIDYKQLTWADFKGAAPASSAFDAETSSDIEYPDTTTVKPLYPETASTEICTVKNEQNEEIKTPKTTVEIKLDNSGIVAKPFLNQEASWVKPVFKSATEMRKVCTAQTAGSIKACKAYFTNTKTANEAACAQEKTKCEAQIAKGNGYKNYEVEATDSAGCSKIKDACKADLNSQMKDETGDGRVSKNETECGTNYMAECVASKEEAARNLLQHEQGHFDVTNIVAKQLQTEVKTLIDSFSGKKFTECKKEDAVKKAQDEVTNILQPKITALIEAAKVKVTAAKASLQAAQDRYDDETNHSTIVEGQSRWNTALGKGALPPPPAKP